MRISAYYRLNSTPDQVDSTMASIIEQREIAKEISDAISNPLNAGLDLDEVRISFLELVLFVIPTIIYGVCISY